MDSSQEGSSTQLTTIDSKGQRLWVYPSDVSGRYRTWRTRINGALVIFFLLLPWLRFGGHQAVLFDFLNGRFSIFGLRFWAHDAPILLFILAGAAVSLAFVTSVWGRLWCGWMCPQTVFVDGVFRRIERWVEGNSIRRRQLDQSPMSREKVIKKALKWSIYTAVALILSHSFMAYFIGTEKLAAMVAGAPAQNWGIFVAMWVMTAAVLFDFGWLREQFCTLLCPYGRFQSVLMDERSLAVAYDHHRGEPRRNLHSSNARSGDCVNCLKCVRVCPTGIDIRNGLQMECIACTACMDACDSVMLKIGKPPGLIRYASIRESGWRGFLRPLSYLAVLSLTVSGLVWILSIREPIEITLIRKVGAPYDEVLRPGFEKEVVNNFKLDLLNQTFETIEVGLVTSPTTQDAVQFVSADLPLSLKAGESKRIDLFARFPLSRMENGRAHATLHTATRLQSSPVSHFKRQEVPLVGPLR